MAWTIELNEFVAHNLKYNLIFSEKCSTIVMSCTNFQVLEFMLSCEGKNSNSFMHLWIWFESQLEYVEFLIFITPNDVEKLVN